MSEPQVPVALKRIFRPDTTDSTVCCAEDRCTKTFSDPATFERELSVYRRRLPYVPRMLSYDRDARSITMTKAGAPLGTVWDSGVPLLHMKRDRSAMKHRIRRMHRQFRKDTGLYHNDVNFKNVLRDASNVLYLIDFEHASETNWERDVDDILSGHSTRWIVLLLGVLSVLVLFGRR